MKNSIHLHPDSPFIILFFIIFFSVMLYLPYRVAEKRDLQNRDVIERNRGAVIEYRTNKLAFRVRLLKRRADKIDSLKIDREWLLMSMPRGGR